MPPYVNFGTLVLTAVDAVDACIHRESQELEHFRVMPSAGAARMINYVLNSSGRPAHVAAQMDGYPQHPTTFFLNWFV